MIQKLELLDITPENITKKFGNIKEISYIRYINKEIMKTKEQLAQWVIDNRYGKSLLEKISDKEIYDTIVEGIEKIVWDRERGNDPHLSQGNNDFPQPNTYVEPWESMGK